MVKPFGRFLNRLFEKATNSQRAAFEKQRDFSRAHVDAKVTIFLEGRTFQGRLHDVSISGAMLEPNCGLNIGNELELELPNIPGRVTAQVMRLLDDRIGVRFSNPGVGVLIAGWSRGTSTTNTAAPSHAEN